MAYRITDRLTWRPAYTEPSFRSAADLQEYLRVDTRLYSGLLETTEKAVANAGEGLLRYHGNEEEVLELQIKQATVVLTADLRQALCKNGGGWLVGKKDDRLIEELSRRLVSEQLTGDPEGNAGPLAGKSGQKIKVVETGPCTFEVVPDDGRRRSRTRITHRY